ncbi:serine/threonine kinase [Nostoc carneum NIES-2107]|nr:serine/threonine kinase [Nostoc carneum NIES-2107]
MIYCINPWCPGEEHRLNLIDASSCQYCGTNLLINGRFHLLEPLRQLSRDDNYQIFKIKDTTNNERRVLKTQIRRDPTLDRLFNQEKNLLLNMNERTLPRGIDSFSVNISNPERRELPCFVMEYIDGKNLEDWIRENGKIGSNQSSLEAKSLALDLLKQLTNILSYIHEQGVIHRDIKPSNIMLRSNVEGKQEPVLIDFGIAKKYVPGVTATNVYGVWGYTPSEVQNGKPVFQSDFYALGRTFVYLLTKKHPHEYGNQLQVWHKDTVFPYSGIIKLINDLIRERPEDRPQSTNEILQRIEEIRNRELQRRTILPLNFWLYDIFAVIGLVATVAVLGYLLFIALTDQRTQPQAPVGVTPSSPPKTPSPSPIPTKPADELISWGEKSIYDDPNLKEDNRRLKAEGIEAFKQDSTEGYQDAVNKFEEIINNGGKDPEVQIFLNNAKIRQNNKNKPIYTIAVVAPITNVNSQNQENFFAPGQQILFGVAQAQTKAIEEQGINLEVVIANDRNFKEQAQSVAQEISKMTVKNRSIIAVIGNYTSDVTCAALQKYDQNLVVISPSSSRSNLRTDCNHQAFFRTTSSVKIEAQSLANHLVKWIDNSKLNRPKIAVLYNKDDKYSLELFNEFTSKVSSKLQVEISGINLNDRNLNDIDIPTKVGDSNILALFPDGSTNKYTAYKNAIAVLNNIDRFNTVQKIIGSNPLLQFEAITNRDKLSTKKFVLATDWDFNCGNKSFTNPAYKKWGGAVNRLTALSYEAVQVLFPIFQLQQPLYRETIFQKLEQQNYVTSDVFDPKNGINKISFDLSNGDRKEIKNRLLVTPDTSTIPKNKQFILLGDEERQCNQGTSN